MVHEDAWSTADQAAACLFDESNGQYQVLPFLAQPTKNHELASHILRNACKDYDRFH